jgi:prophage regulatory protein
MPKLLLFDELKDSGVPFTRRHIDKLERVNKFPRRIAISAHRVAWIESEIVDWVAKQIATRTTTIGRLGSGDRIKARNAGLVE